ncbi:hypothetical protein D3C81_2045470 [compost metagenome]
MGKGRPGVRQAALLLGENPRTVYAWYRGERYPGFLSARNIVRVSRGRVDYNGIFRPLARALEQEVAHD